MRILKIQLLILIIYVNESSCWIDSLFDAGKKVWELYSTLDASYLPCSTNPRTIEELFGNDYIANKELRSQIYEVHRKLRVIQNLINKETKNNLMRIMKSATVIFKTLGDMEVVVKSIDDAYNIFYQIIIQDGYIHNRPLENLTSVFSDIESNLGMIRKFMTDAKSLLPGESSLIGAITNYAKTQYEKICNSYQSIDEILVYLFKIVILAEIKSSLMLPFGNLRLCRTTEDWKLLNSRTQSQFQTYFRSYITIMHENLDLTANLYMRACDPTDNAWIPNTNYYEFEGMKQAVIFRYQPSCASCPFTSCRNLWQKRTTCDAKYYDARSGCSNTPTDCEDLGAVQACVLKSGPYKFQYVNSSKLGFFGTNSECLENDGYILDNFNGAHAGYGTCSCQCIGNDYKISLAIMEPRKDSNDVIIGLRFKRRNDILYIQPRMGVLMGNGTIQKTSESWLPIPNDVDKSQLHPINEENNIFFLDDVLLPPKFVLTGVKFNKVTRGSVTGFAIEIFGVSFDYKTGQLSSKNKIQLSSLRHDSGRPLVLDAISPLLIKKNNLPSPTDRKFIQLQQSYLRSDFGQSMLPLFDAVPVTTDPPSALTGIGIFHKGVQDCTGFISLRTYGIRYVGYFEKFISTHTTKGRLQLFI